MSVKLHVLASGSSGNASVLEADGFGVLIDFGLSPRQLAPRMLRCGISWDDIHAVLLTHPHSDHWQASTLSHLAKLGRPIYCHGEHLKELAGYSGEVVARHYEPEATFALQPDLQCRPIALPHDGVRTCGFRFDGPGWALGYLADLGSWTPALAVLMRDVDLLALEFNHDIPMQLGSGRHPQLIRRVLGDHGHLSNEQAADLLTAVLTVSTPGRLKHLVQLHLSRHCNTAELAHASARQALERLDVEISIFTADQDQKGTTIDVLGSEVRVVEFMQTLLPFAD